MTLALALLFTLQGIPCIYYGTEQGLSGTIAPDGTPDLGANESVREALWGKTPIAFDPNDARYTIRPWRRLWRCSRTWSLWTWRCPN